MNNDFVVESLEFDNTVSGLNRVTMNSMNEVDSIPIKFLSLKSSGLFGNGIDKINKQLNAVTMATINVKNKIYEHEEKIFTLESSMASKARELNAPLDFVKNDSQKYNSIDDIYLEKKDGRSVNDGNNLEKTSELDDYSGTIQDLTNITSDLELKEEKINEKTVIVEQQKLENINNLKETNEQKIEEIDNINFYNLKNINNGNNIKVITPDNESIIKYNNISNINKHTNSINDNIEILEIEGE